MLGFCKVIAKSGSCCGYLRRIGLNSEFYTSCSRKLICGGFVFMTYKGKSGTGNLKAFRGSFLEETKVVCEGLRDVALFIVALLPSCKWNQKRGDGATCTKPPHLLVAPDCSLFLRVRGGDLDGVPSYLNRRHVFGTDTHYSGTRAKGSESKWRLVLTLSALMKGKDFI
uniref:Uncharacterized protein n=1 Tax=Strigamia maritima TaxID=126957 RepID=T1IWD3_STRMM